MRFLVLLYMDQVSTTTGGGLNHDDDDDDARMSLWAPNHMVERVALCVTFDTTRTLTLFTTPLLDKDYYSSSSSSYPKGTCQGMYRIAEALHANLWSNAVLLASTKLSTCFHHGGGDDHGETGLCPSDLQKKTGKPPVKKTGPDPPTTSRRRPQQDLAQIERLAKMIRKVRDEGKNYAHDKRRAMASEAVLKLIRTLDSDEDLW